MDLKLTNEVRELVQQRESEGDKFNQVEHQDLYELIQFVNTVGRFERRFANKGYPWKRILVARQKGKVVGFCI
ncbi:hypothetical protein J32TS6_14440 [Virgibacillus pantothenticus]|uniref:hypothetical protein n=1 Tax=Virgibacillus TaxID=84406 RepID=UPI000A9E8616|nr:MULTISPECIES: hypothetical protein [Virgibacillus]MED3736821.1 hypothetical protein [Virgibacillus pantothenticus]GIP62889.1 hypothetical protein J32TS6_14440 [Virgibacillus pantothenticus]